MSSHRFGAPGDHVVFAAGAVAMSLGLAGSAVVPGLEAFLNGVVVGLVGLLLVAAAGWAVHQLAGEIRLQRELRRAPRPPREGWRTCLRPVPGEAPAAQPATGDEGQAEPVGGEAR